MQDNTNKITESLHFYKYIILTNVYTALKIILLNIFFLQDYH